MARKSGSDGPTGMALVEESVQLLRQVPTTWWALYLAGTVPWVVGWFWTWSRWVWMQPDIGEQVWLAMLITGLFFWLKGMQAECASRLLRWRAGQDAAAWSWSRWFQRARRQFRRQAWGLIVLPFMAVLTIPFGWAMAYYQNLTVLADEEDGPDQAQERLKDWPMQNHAGLLGLSLAFAVVWINIASCFYLLPWLANRFLGIENLLAMRGVMLLNSTFLLMVTALSWLAVDPLVKAFYTLRVFYGRSRREAGDLRVELAGFRSSRAVGLVVLLGGLLLVGSGGPLGAQTDPAAPVPAPATVVSDAEMTAAIERALAHPDFKWSLQPPPVVEEGEPPGWMKAVVDSGIDILTGLRDTISRWWNRIEAWIDGLTKPDLPEAESKPREQSGWMSGFWDLVLYAILAAIVILFVILVWMAIRRGRSPAGLSLDATAVESIATPDLRDERVHAAQLPWERWLEMARDCMEKGEWRLAWRALFLAQLARFGAEDWVRLDPAKTNMDYERELMRRGLPDPTVVDTFRERRRGFEWVWYGRGEVQPDQAEAWWSELQRVVEPTADLESQGGTR